MHACVKHKRQARARLCAVAMRPLVWQSSNKKYDAVAHLGTIQPSHGQVPCLPVVCKQLSHKRGIRVVRIDCDAVALAQQLVPMSKQRDEVPFGSTGDKAHGILHRVPWLYICTYKRTYAMSQARGGAVALKMWVHDTRKYDSGHVWQWVCMAVGMYGSGYEPVHAHTRYQTAFT